MKSKKELQQELEELSEYIASVCNEQCTKCGFYRANQEPSCLATNLARELQLKIEELKK